jgi:parallel beta-helix repeat protein
MKNINLRRKNMKNGSFKKVTILGIVAVFAVASIIPAIASSSFTGKKSFSNERKTIMQSTLGEIIIVDNEGDGDYRSIQDAIDHATAGDTIEVYSGTYIENANVFVRVILKGIPHELGSGDDTGMPVVDGGGSGDAIKITADGCILSAFTVINSSPYPKVGVKVCSDHNNISENNITDNCHGIFLDKSSKNNFSGNNVTANTFGISLYSSFCNTFSGNNITNNDDWGIYVRNSSYNRISENNITGNNGYGIFTCLHSSNNIISKNYIINNNQDIPYRGSIFLHDSCRNIVCRNIITNNYKGISLDMSDKNKVRGNYIADNTDVGIELEDGSHFNEIFGNTISNNRYGTKTIYADYNLIKHNNFLNNTIHAYFEAGRQYKIFAFTCFNFWAGNYWDDWLGPIPKPIFGTFEYPDPDRPWHHKKIPWVNFDWCPQIKPYDIVANKISFSNSSDFPI